MMKYGSLEKKDPLAGIEDMLSSLCGARSTRTDFVDGYVGDDQEETQKAMHQGHAQDDISSHDEVPTTPERTTPPQPRHCKRAMRKKRLAQSRSSKRIPPAQGIKKSQRGRNKKRSALRGGIQSTLSPNAADAEQHDHEILATSSDDQENANFLNQMKRLAEEHLDANQRKNDAMNTSAINAMKRHSDECVQRMKQIAGKVSSDIINRAAVVEDALPNDMKKETAVTMNSIKSANDILNNLLLQAKSFEDQMNKLVHHVQEQRKETKEKHEAEEKQIRENAMKVTASGEHLTSVLQKIDELLAVDQFKES